MRKLLFVLAVLSTGCTPFYKPDASVRSLTVEFGNQPQRALFEKALDNCRVAIEAGLGNSPSSADDYYGSVYVKFVPVGQANQICPTFKNKPRIAGCWIREYGDVVVVEEAPTLDQTSLCHELAHRRKYEATKGATTDPDHTDAVFWKAVADRATTGVS